MDVSGSSSRTIFLFRAPSESSPKDLTRLSRTSGVNEGGIGTTTSNASHPTFDSESDPTKSSITFEDDYTAAFAERGYLCRSIPVLEHQICNLDALRRELLSSSDRYCALIITSKRAVEALTEVWESGVCELKGSLGFGCLPSASNQN